MKPMYKLFFLLIAILLLSLSACNSARGETKAASQSNTREASDMTESAAELKILVTYFSCTGNTRSVAEQIANVLNVTLHEIQPETPYTSADLNWRNKSSRSSMENSDPSFRPAVSGSVENMEQYNIIFLGYPIWWGQAPRIINTFLESYDFSNKTIVPFCTSGTSGVGSSAANLQKLCSDSATWTSGFRLSSNSSRAAIAKWINELGLGITAEN